jgi:ABC-type transporter Mla subunit MlaD
MTTADHDIEKLRTEARKARVLAISVGDERTTEQLHKFADELEQRAAELEETARRLATNVEITRRNAAELDATAKKLRRTVGKRDERGWLE